MYIYIFSDSSTNDELVHVGHESIFNILRG